MALEYIEVGHLFPVQDGGSSGEVVITPVSVTDDTAVSLLPALAFIEAAVTRPHAAAEVISLLWRRLQSEEEALSGLLCLPIRARVARKLVELAERDSDRIVRVPQHELAALVGTSREKVTKVLRDFRLHGLIGHERHSHEICVIDLDRLAAEVRGATDVSNGTYS
jgi:CRP/FNR family transcriptional regulator, cyclic AMP receptor protein